MKKDKRIFPFVSTAPLLLFAVFAVAVLSVLVTGTRTLSKISAEGEDNRNMRVAVRYITTRVQGAERGSVFVDELDGLPALAVREYIDGQPYLTRIYCHDGYLRELFTDTRDDVLPEDGEMLLPMSGMEVSAEGGLLYVKIISVTGEERILVLSLKDASDGSSLQGEVLVE